MLFTRTSLGVEINQSGVAFALLGGTPAAPRLERAVHTPLPTGAVRSSLREPNILDLQAFVESFQNAHNLLLHRSKRLSLTLPDSVGRIILLDMEGRFKNRTEGLDMIRWKLKKNIPFDVSDTHLDYQLLKIRENGDMALLVALASRTVIEQYENALTSAGFTPARIDFNSFNLYRIFDRRLALLDDSLLIYFHNGALGIMAYYNGVPEFIRVKELPGTSAVDNRVFMEINNSLLVHRERFPERNTANVFCIAPPDVASAFCSMVSEAAGSEAILLETKTAVTPGREAPGDQESFFLFSAAIGAALRSL
ncbi:type IV pilus biogenesis protein PilM [Geobacter sp. AOG2]|uniref:type IV pilus biogenesis protein PilM n=1 Tax=Geobacter sp. AOG2 TaxID=1566347 RepID=UPI001CC6D561|nr:pilus assembly protein PilM [Geobacter sp. AOG2]GFE61612.1 pilus assembly protein PilM [Geobacter sp. AOG2]